MRHLNPNCKSASRSISIAILTLAIVSFMTATQSMAVTASLGINLIENPGAELGVLSPNATNTVVVAWEDGLTYGDTTAGGVNNRATSTVYVPAFAGMGTPTSPGGLVGNEGNAYFYGGEGPGDFSVTQTIDVSSLSGTISSGSAQFDMAGFFGGFATNGDIARLSATFRDSSNASIGTVTIGPATHGLGSLVFTADQATGFVPVDTNSIEYAINFDVQNGSNDGRADNLSFVINKVDASAVPAPAAAWQFNGNLANDIAGGADLVNTIPSAFTTSNIGGNVAQVLDLAAASGSGENMRAVNPIGANGGGAFTNDFTLAFDVNFPTFPGTGGFASLLQTNANNANDVDFFVRSNGDIDLGSGNVPAGITADTWYRLVFTNKNIGGINETLLYVDGVLIGGVNNGVDGTFTLESNFFIFSDNDGDTVRTLVNSAALWEGALTAGEIARLGRASVNGLGALALPVPEPTTGLLVLLAGAALTRRRRAA